jgi:hypothetical protein
MTLIRSNTESIRYSPNCGIHDGLDPGFECGIDDMIYQRAFEMAVLG